MKVFQLTTVKLSQDEFDHILANPPGICDCELCKWFWLKVGEWVRNTVGLEKQMKERRKEELDKKTLTIYCPLCAKPMVLASHPSENEKEPPEPDSWYCSNCLISIPKEDIESIIR